MRLRVALLATAASLAAAAPAAAVDYTVTGFGDAPGACSGTSCPTLRSAVAAANTSSGEDLIRLGAGTYNLPSGALVITEKVTITGAGPRATTIDADTSGDRVFTISSPTETTLAMMTIRDGFSGANGGNIRVTPGANLALAFVRVTGGVAQQGAGIGNEGDLKVANSTIDGNSAQMIGGGIDNWDVSGAAELVVGNSTIANNYGGDGGGISSRGAGNSVDLLGVTLARNTGGGIWLQEQQQNTVFASIIAANLTLDNCTGPGRLNDVDNRSNVDSGASCGLPAGTNLLNTDPLLAAALGDGGEPFSADVLTIPANSPAAGYVAPCINILDQRAWNRPAAACSAGAYDPLATDPDPGGGGGGEQPPPTPTPQPPAPTPTPTPVVNQSAVAREQRGTVKVLLPGTKTFIDLDATRGIPMGSTIDTRKGAVEITTVPKAGAPPEKATFNDGLFKLTQRGGITNLTLVEELDCKKGKRASASQKAKKPKKRRLWGDGKGSFRTTGRYSAATVRGTKWLVEDTCTTTTTRVTQGSVTVRHGKKQVVVRAGKRYVARAKK